MSDFFGTALDNDDLRQDEDPMSALAIDDTLPLLEKIEKYINSGILLHRLYLIRTLAESAKQIGLDETRKHLIPVLERLLQDREAAVRQALVEQIPSFCRFLLDSGNEEAYTQILHIFVPMVAEMTTDPNQQVRASAADVFLQLSSLLHQSDLEPYLLPIVKSLANDNIDEEHRLEAAFLLLGMAETLGLDLCLRFSMPLISKLSADNIFRVRKAIAGNLGTISRTIGSDATITEVMPILRRLCEDEIWGVRRAAAESLVSVGSSMHPSQRLDQLLPLFDQLAQDTSRWVKGSAFQSLGPLIALFPGNQVTSNLLQYFISMAKPEPSQEADLVLYCAYNFPAVLVTVGPDRWSELAPTYASLVQEREPRVRRTLAFSLHEVARILGKAKTEEVLTSIFDKFFNDIEEVKVGVITHLVKFLAVLSTEGRKRYLPLLVDIQADKNWRFRKLIAKQLRMLAQLYDIKSTTEVIVTLTVHLCHDQVAAVRKSANRQIGVVLNRLIKDDPQGHMRIELERQIVSMGTHASYQRRQQFLMICEDLIHQIDESLFETKVLPIIFALQRDKVSNVRVALVQVIRQMLSMERFAKHKDLSDVLQKLKDDKDRDVRHFANSAESQHAFRQPFDMTFDIYDSSDSRRGSRDTSHDDESSIIDLVDDAEINLFGDDIDRESRSPPRENFKLKTETIPNTIIPNPNFEIPENSSREPEETETTPMNEEPTSTGPVQVETQVEEQVEAQVENQVEVQVENQVEEDETEEVSIDEAEPMDEDNENLKDLEQEI